jgi:hypothetical protein
MRSRDAYIFSEIALSEVRSELLREGIQAQVGKDASRIWSCATEVLLAPPFSWRVYFGMTSGVHATNCAVGGLFVEATPAVTRSRLLQPQSLSPRRTQAARRTSASSTGAAPVGLARQLPMPPSPLLRLPKRLVGPLTLTIQQFVAIHSLCCTIQQPARYALPGPPPEKRSIAFGPIGDHSGG